jgi:hypothetical protein
MELNEYRQVAGCIGVALFVAGIAVWPAGVTCEANGLGSVGNRRGHRAAGRLCLHRRIWTTTGMLAA